jgi:nucleoside-diphosphate-sugar epimerase
MNSQRDIVVVTGSGGYIGRAVVSRLAEHFTIVALDRQPPSELPSAVVSADRPDV